MKTITIKGQLVGYHFEFMADSDVAWGFSEGAAHKIGGNTIAVIPHSFTAEVPDNMNMVALQIAALEAEKANAAAEFGATVKRINERLSKLQAITNEVEA